LRQTHTKLIGTSRSAVKIFSTQAALLRDRPRIGSLDLVQRKHFDLWLAFVELHMFMG